MVRKTPRKKDKDKENHINGEIYLMNKWISMIKSLDEIVNSKYYELSNSPYLLISGRAGTGKTHLLCDLTLKKLNAKKPILMVLAQDFNNITDPLDQIAKETRFAKSKHQLLENLAGLADKISERALIIIDGINESDYDGCTAWPIVTISQCSVPEATGFSIQKIRRYLLAWCRWWKQTNHELLDWFIDACWDEAGCNIARCLQATCEIFSEHSALEIKPHSV